MANKHLNQVPHDCNIGPREAWWWYELPGGIQIYHRGKDHEVKHMLIPWASLRGALRRKDKP